MFKREKSYDEDMEEDFKRESGMSYKEHEAKVKLANLAKKKRATRD